MVVSIYASPMDVHLGYLDKCQSSKRLIFRFWLYCTLIKPLTYYTLLTSLFHHQTIRGVLTHWITSYATAGQYFDRPSPQLLAKQAGVGDSRTLSAFTSSSFRYTWNLILVRILFPFLKQRQGNRKHAPTRSGNVKSAEVSAHHQTQPPSFRRKGGDRDTASSVAGHTGMGPSLHKILQLWNNKIAPLIQISIPACTLIYYTWRLPFAKYLFPLSGAGKSSIDDMKWFGAFQKMEQPPWSEVFFVISVPTVISLLFFTRLINPIPDLVAGSNVLKAVRNEAKTFGGVNSVSELLSNEISVN